MINSPAAPGAVFISYSHQDVTHLARLQRYLSPHVHNGTILLWDDTRLKPGDEWKRSIERALSSARVAVLLVSVDFLASEFITQVEVPLLLAAAEARGTCILPVILTPCLFRRTTLSRFQAVNDPALPLSGLSQHEQDLVWERVVDTVLDVLDAPIQVSSASEPPLPLPPAPISDTSKRDAMGTVQHFIDNDEGYLHWIATNRQGFVVDCYREPTPTYLILHRATCPTLSKLPGYGTSWTKDYRKVCSSSRVDLQHWAQQEIHGSLNPCEHCHP